MDDYSDVTVGLKQEPVNMEALRRLVLDQLDAGQAVEKAQAELKKAQARYRSIAENDIPAMLERAGIMHMRMVVDGAEFDIVVDSKMRASAPRDRKEEMFAWLDEHGMGGAIKRTVEVAFAKNQGDEAKVLLRELQEKFRARARAVAKVEPATLTALVNSMVDDGIEFPHDLFGAHEHREAKIKER